MSSKLNELKRILGMGARSNKYKIMITAPIAGGSEVEIDTLCKGASIPTETVGIVEVYNQGRKLNIAGDRSYEGSISYTFYLTQDHKLRDDFVKWIDFIDNFEEHNRGKNTDIGHDDYMIDGARVQQLNTSTNEVTANYKFYNFFPTEVGEVELADDNQDQVSEFTVNFSYSHITRED